VECGAGRLDTSLTGWRREHAWLGEGGSVPQQQIIRDFATSRAKALKDIKNRLPVRKRAVCPGSRRRRNDRPFSPGCPLRPGEAA
jgi:putative transposase